MTQTLYVVMGETGEYSDRSEWPVRAFSSEAKAQAFVLEVEAWLIQQGLHYDSPGRAPYSGQGEILSTCPHHAVTSVDYTGARLFVMEVPLDDDVRHEIAEAFVEEAGQRAISFKGVEP